jgi:hypothetical protein
LTARLVSNQLAFSISLDEPKIGKVNEEFDFFSDYFIKSLVTTMGVSALGILGIANINSKNLFSKLLKSGSIFEFIFNFLPFWINS